MNQQPQSPRNLLQAYGLFKGPNVLAQILMGFLAPFAGSVEVFVRRDMGERYYTFGNFMAGLLAIGFIRLLNFFLNSFTSSGGSGFSLQSFNWLYMAWLAYIFMGIYHFFYQWYRDVAKEPIYSFDMGESRFFWPAKVFLAVINRFVTIPLKVISLVLPRRHREHLLALDIRFKDYQAFAYKFLEPFTIILLGILFFPISGFVTFWLVLSGLVLAVHSSQILSQERDMFLDMRDSQIMATQLQAALKSQSNTLRVSQNFKNTFTYMAEHIEESPELLNPMYNTPSVTEALAMLNPDLRKEESDKAKNSES